MNIPRQNNYFLVSRRERWGLTFPGLLIVLLLLIFFIVIIFNNIYSTLSPIKPVRASILVLEGAINDHVLKAAIDEFYHNEYQLIITTGTPLEYGAVLSEYKNTATIAGKSLIKLGIDSTHLIILGTDAIINDRTYNSAIKLKQWIRKNKPTIKSINLMSLGVHGGRSHLLFQAALGDSIQVGIISVQNQYYNEGLSARLLLDDKKAR